MVVAMRTATARLLRWGSKSNAPRVWVRGHGLCVQLRAVKQAVKFGNLEKWKFWTRFWNAKKWHMHTSTCLKHLASLDLFHLYNLYIYIYFKKHLQLRRTVATTDKPSCFLPSLHIDEDWINNKLAASHGFFWGKSTENIEQNYSTLRSLAGSHFLLSKPWCLNRPGLHIPSPLWKKAYPETKIRHLPTRHAVTIMW